MIERENIPVEMRGLPQWVCWRFESRDGKKTKVPMRADGKGRASSTNSETWATFDAALAAVDKFDGIGFVTQANCEIILLDLDHCVHDGEIAEYAKEILSLVNSTVEISPSGTGLHAYFRGALPGRGKKCNDMEIYDCGRFFCVTGKLDPTCSKPFRALTDEETAAVYKMVVARGKSAADAPVAAPVGGVQADPPSRHDHLVKIATALSRCGVSPEVISAAVMGQNALYVKGPKPVAEAAGVIKWAVEHLGERAPGENEKPFPQVVSSVEHFQNPPPLQPELIEGILRRKHRMIIGGPSKAYKSWLTIRLALAIAYGEKWLDHLCTKGRVLVVNCEVHPGSYWRRVVPVASAMGVECASENLDFLHLRGCSTDIEEFLPLLRDAIAGKGYIAVIIDPQYQLFRSNKIRNFSENDAASLIYFYGEIDKIFEDEDTALILVGHFSKGMQGLKNSIDRISGSGVGGRNFDAICTLTELEEDDCYRVEFCLRDFKKPDPLSVKWEFPMHVADPMLNGVRLRGERAPATDKGRSGLAECDDQAIVSIVAAKPGLSKRAVTVAGQGRGMSQGRARAAIERVIGMGTVISTDGPRRSEMLTLAEVSVC